MKTYRYIVYQNNRQRVGPKNRIDPACPTMGEVRDDYEELGFIDALDVIDAKKKARQQFNKKVEVKLVGAGTFGRTTLLP